MKHTKNLVFMSLFAALIAVGAFIRVPMPLIPFTLQTFFVMMAGNLLGAKYAAGGTLVYVLIGLCGVPVFTGGGGFTYIFQPTFGYLIGFIFAALFIGMIVHKKEQPSWKRLLAGDLVGVVVWYVFGIIYYWMIAKYYLGDPVAMKSLLVPFILLPLPGDLIKMTLAILLGKRLLPIISK